MKAQFKPHSKEKFIREMRECLHFWNLNFKSEEMKNLLDEFEKDTAVAEKEKKDEPNKREEWISVKDRLPEHTGFYLVYVETDSEYANDYHRIGKFSVKSGWYLPNSDDAVTHWQPLPEPPKNSLSSPQGEEEINQNQASFPQKCEGCGRTPTVIYATPTGRFCQNCKPN